MLSFILYSCATKPPVDFKTYNQGSWSSQVYLKDKVKNSSVFFSMRIRSQKDKFFRFDITSPLGDPVGSFIVEGNQMRYLNIMHRQYVFGRAHEKSMNRLFKVPLSPKVIYAFLFDEPMNASWRCVEEKPPYSHCQNERSGVTVKWQSRKASDRVIFVLHKKAQVKIKLTDFDSNLVQEESHLDLKVPKRFKQIKL